MGMRPAARMGECHWWTPWLRRLIWVVIFLSILAAIFGLMCLAVWAVMG